MLWLKLKFSSDYCRCVGDDGALRGGGCGALRTDASIRQHTNTRSLPRRRTDASTPQHTSSAYVSMRQHASAYARDPYYDQKLSWTITQIFFLYAISKEFWIIKQLLIRSANC
jgi:hypothetical protein